MDPSAEAKCPHMRHMWMATTGKEIFTDLAHQIDRTFGKTPLGKMRPEAISEIVDLANGKYGYDFASAIVDVPLELALAAAEMARTSEEVGARLRQNYREIQQFSDASSFTAADPVSGVFASTKESLEFAFGAALQLASQVIYQGNPNRVLTKSDLPVLIEHLSHPNFDKIARQAANTAFGVLTDNFFVGRSVGTPVKHGMPTEEKQWRARMGLTETDVLISVTGSGEHTDYELNPKFVSALRDGLREAHKDPSVQTEVTRTSSGCPVKAEAELASHVLARALQEVQLALTAPELGVDAGRSLS